MNLPPLRTVHTVGTSPATSASSLTTTPAPQLVTTPAPLSVTTPAPPIINTPRPLDASLQGGHIPAALRQLLQELLDLKLIDASVVRQFLTQTADRLPHLIHRERAAQSLVHASVITGYQRDRVLAGSTFGLMLGHYRILDRIGGGSVGVVFLGEHVHLRRRVAIKVLPVDPDLPAEIQDRFHTEMRLLASLQHPHVVAAFDAGVLVSHEPAQPSLHYLVLELVPGGDLEQYVCSHGPLSVERACEWARQAAAGLQAAHDLHLVHRDVKPSNLLLTETSQIKLVDFGLARQLASNITSPSMILGSVEFMSPEQSLDPTNVGPAADVYGLGSTLFWVLTGQLAIPRSRNVTEMVEALRTGKPRRLKEVHPEVPAALDDFIDRMLARDPASRPTALEAMTAFSNFTGSIEPANEQRNGPPTDSEVIRLRQTVRQLERSLKSRETDVGKAEEAVLFALAKMAESHDNETAGHQRRMQEYVRILAAKLADHADWVVLKNSQYVAELLRCVAIHDIGKIGLPDLLLNKPAKLTDEERSIAEKHPHLGCEILEALARKHGETLRFLGMARAVIRHHHERWDGHGYPDRLAGQAIPPAARLVALADVYDSLRRARAQRPAMSHPDAMKTVLNEGGGYFDPTVIVAFSACEKKFDEVFLTIPN